ncbi:MAG: PLP-dependent aminotransferase family protein [Proteobacteria bacterium]|nr:PLP-dependent aminotransferase family protein [Pseudomonadota bacterium]
MIAIRIDREADQPLYAQIRDALMAAIRNGRLGPGERLPTVAAFATGLGVTQGTVRRAYEDLIKSGKVFSQVGRGTFVLAPEPAGSQEPLAPAPPPSAPSVDPEVRLAAQRLRTDIARSLEGLFVLQDRPGVIRFTSGFPAPDSIRPGLLEEMTGRALADVPEVHQSTLEPAGLPSFREELARYFRSWGLSVTPDHILVTSGSQQALALIAQAAGPEDRILYETPCYTGVPGAFEAFDRYAESVPRDPDGPELGRLGRFSDERPGLFYICPELHNPMGLDLAPDRTITLAAWGREHRMVFVTDMIFHDLRFEGVAPPMLALEAGLDHSIMVGSFSKSFLASLRVGWLVSTPERVRGLASLKKAMDQGTATLPQAVVLSALRSGAYDDHLASVRKRYRQRRDVMIEALGNNMPEGVEWTTPPGGFNMWVRLPPGYSSVALYFLAVEQGVSFIPGPYMDRDHRFINAFRISYSQVEPDQIREGVRRLAASVHELVKGPPSEPGLSGLGDFL